MVLCQLDTSLFLGDYLVSTFAACGSLENAMHIFYRLPHGSVYSWTSLISECIECGRFEDVVVLYKGMMDDFVEPNDYTIVSLLRACAATQDLAEGMRLHDAAHRMEFMVYGHVGSALINMYGKCWCREEAENVFNMLPRRDSVSWNALLTVYTEQADGDRALHAYNCMQLEGAYTNKQTHLIALRACCASAEKEVGMLFGSRVLKSKSLDSGRALHLEAEKKGFVSDVFLCSTLVSMYGKCGSTSEAEMMYMSLAWHDVVSGSALLSAYLEQKQGQKVLQLYREMPDVDKQMIVVCLQACCLLADEPAKVVVALEVGRAIHTDCRRKGLLDVFVGSALITVYGKCHCLQEAESVFSMFACRDVAFYNAMLGVYVEQGKCERALQLYRDMHAEGVSADERTVVRAFQACSKLVKKSISDTSNGIMIRELVLVIVQALHSDVKCRRLDQDSFVCNTLISTYGTCWNIDEAESVFSLLPHRDSVAWNAMLSAYMEQEQADKVLQLCMQMREAHARVDDTTFSYVLQACCESGTIHICRHVHHSIIFAGYENVPLLVSGLIRAYTSYAAMQDAQNVFDGFDAQDLAVWTSLISGYALQGDSVASLGKYRQMLDDKIHPTEATYISIISSCGHANMIDTAFEYLMLMTADNAVEPKTEHYNCVLDLLGRAGEFGRVKDLLSMMVVEPDLVTWLCLLTACMKHGNIELGREFFENAINLQPAHAAAYSLMSNIYTNAGLFELASEINNLRLQNINVNGRPGNT
ncbi:hypothetical protein KP509_29G023300 [Ceratopteris richardii]|nr:hypothetical protein KP509_29G023300 [Ceratopteris richardii]